MAIRKIGWRWSCIQDSSVPNIRCDSPPSAESLLAEAKAFSISSIHSTTGAIDSAWLQGLAEPGLALADELLVEHARVHPHQRHPPGRGDHLGAEALAAALHAQAAGCPAAGRGRTRGAGPIKPPCRRFSQRLRFFSPPISSGETSATIDSRQPVVPSRLRLASTIRGRSGASSTLWSWIAPGDDPGGLLGGQPAQRLHQHVQLALGQLAIRPAEGCVRCAS